MPNISHATLRILTLSKIQLTSPPITAYDTSMGYKKTKICGTIIYDKHYSRVLDRGSVRRQLVVHGDTYLLTMVAASLSTPRWKTHLNSPLPAGVPHLSHLGRLHPDCSHQLGRHSPRGLPLLASRSEWALV